MKKQKMPFGLRMPDEVKEFVKRQAETERRSVNSLIVLVLEDYKRKQEAEHAAA